MNKHVLSIEEMRELKELGINTSKASMCWNTYDSFLIANDENLKDSFNYSDDDWIPTFTLQDILTILPTYITHNDGEYEYKWNIMPFGEEYVVQYLDTDGINPALVTMKDVSLLQACFNILKWCKQNNYI